MGGNQGTARRGRPLSFVSVQVLEKIAAERTITTVELSTALQLSRRHATVVCAKLAAAGHLQVIGQQGKHNVYAPGSGSRKDEPTWFMLGQALRP